MAEKGTLSNIISNPMAVIIILVVIIVLAMVGMPIIDGLISDISKQNNLWLIVGALLLAYIVFTVFQSKGSGIRDPREILELSHTTNQFWKDPGLACDIKELKILESYQEPGMILYKLINTTKQTTFWVPIRFGAFGVQAFAKFDYEPDMNLKTRMFGWEISKEALEKMAEDSDLYRKIKGTEE